MVEYLVETDFAALHQIGRTHAFFHCFSGAYFKLAANFWSKNDGDRSLLNVVQNFL